MEKLIEPSQDGMKNVSLSFLKGQDMHVHKDISSSLCFRHTMIRKFLHVVPVASFYSYVDICIFFFFAWCLSQLLQCWLFDGLVL